MARSGPSWPQVATMAKRNKDIRDHLTLSPGGWVCRGRSGIGSIFPRQVLEGLKREPMAHLPQEAVKSFPFLAPAPTPGNTFTTAKTSRRSSPGKRTVIFPCHKTSCQDR